MWISSNLLKLTIYLSGYVASFVGFLTSDPSLIWNTDAHVYLKKFLSDRGDSN